MLLVGVPVPCTEPGIQSLSCKTCFSTDCVAHCTGSSKLQPSSATILGQIEILHKNFLCTNRKWSNSMSWAITAVWSSSSPLFKYSIYSKFPQKNILPDFHCLNLKTQAHYKKYVIHMSMIHFYPVHQNAVFVLNVKMPFMSLFMRPFPLLFLNDGRTCFAKLNIYKGICNFILNISFRERSLYMLGKTLIFRLFSRYWKFSEPSSEVY